jgi:hypothetical protein
MTSLLRQAPGQEETGKTLYDTAEYVRHRQREMLSEVARERSAQRAKQLTRVTRQAERADRQLTRSWSEAARLHAEIARITAGQ